MGDYRANDQIKTLDLLAPDEPSPYGGMTTDFHRLLARRALASRPVPRTPGDTRRRQEDVRERLRACLGLGEIPREPPRSASKGILRRGGIGIERIVLEPAEGFFASALLYRRRGARGRRPAVLNVHGHYMDGKHRHDMQARALGLASRGFAVLSLDALGMGERQGQGHHAGFPLLLAGLSLQGLIARENLRAVEWLRTRPFVDPERIGITGSSGGGNQTMYAAALDPRIAAAVPAMSVSTYEDILFRGTGCACEIIPGLMPGVDLPDVLSLIAPRACLVLCGTRDETFPSLGSRTAYERAREAWRLLGAPERIEYEEVYAPHTYDAPVRERMFDFFERVLAGASGRPPAPAAVPVETEPEDSTDLDCFEGRRPPRGSKTLGDLFVPAAAAARTKAPAKPEGRRAGLRALLGLPADLRGRASFRGTHEGGGLSIEKWVIESELGILVPALLLRPPGARGRRLPAVAWLHPLGKNRATWFSDARRILDAGVAILSADLRGIGETENPVNPKAQPDARNGIVMGRPIAGQHAADVEACLGFLRRRGDVDPDRIGLVGVGYGGFVALLAGAAGIGCAAIAADRAPSDANWNGRMGADLRLVVPGLLSLGDPASTFGLNAPRPLLVANPVSFDESPLEPPISSKTLAPLRAAYRLAGASKALKVLHGGTSETAAAVAAFLGRALRG